MFTVLITNYNKKNKYQTVLSFREFHTHELYLTWKLNLKFNFIKFNYLYITKTKNISLVWNF